MSIDDLSNDELLAAIVRASESEKRSIAEALTLLLHIEERRIHLELACTSLFDFCMKKLRWSEGQTCRRLRAARLVARFSSLLDAVAAGRLHLAHLDLLHAHLTEDNVDALVAEASEKTTREVQAIVARIAPKPDVSPSIRKLPSADVGSLAMDALVTPAPVSASVAASSGPAALGVATPAPTRGRKQVLAPLSEDRYEVRLTVSGDVHRLLEDVRSKMRHRNPTGDLEVIFEAAMRALAEKLAKQREGAAARPRKTVAPSNDPGRVSRATRRAVILRDGAQCSWVGPNGERCTSRDFLELDHRYARALGGTGDAANVRLLCRAHNHYEAEKAFGRAKIANEIHRRRWRYDAVARHAGVTATTARVNESADAASGTNARVNESADAASGTNARVNDAADGRDAITALGSDAHARAQEERFSDAKTKRVVESALRSMGFRSHHVTRALQSATWSAPMEAILREAIGKLT